MRSIDALKKERELVENLIESWESDREYKKHKIKQAKEDLEELNETIRIMEE